VTPTETYLRELRAALPPLPLRRRRIVAEVRDHFECAVATERRRGATRPEAERRACARLGPPSHLAAEFAADLRADSSAAASRIAATALVVWFAASVYRLLYFNVLHEHGHARMVWRGPDLFGTSVETRFSIVPALLSVVAVLLLGAAIRDKRMLRVAVGVCAAVPAVHTALLAATSLGPRPSLILWTGETIVGLAGALALAVVNPRGARRDPSAAPEVLIVLVVFVLAGAATLRATSGFVAPLDLPTAMAFVDVFMVPLAVAGLFAGCRTLLTMRRREAG
jgi:hypothetical protein